MSRGAAATGPPRLAAEGVEVRLPGFALGPVDLAVAAGEYLVLVGPSGVGKTVLLEALLGWHPLARGRVLLEGRPLAARPPGAWGIAYVPQELGLLPHLGVEENLLWGVACRGEGPEPALFERLVATLNLGPLLDRPSVTTLSRGEQQRVALGRALLTRPRLLLLDEPCAALDPHRRRRFQRLLRQLHREEGLTALHITHDREEAFLLGDRIGVLLEGRLRQLDTPRAVYDRPADAAVAAFLAPENLWPARRLGEAEGGGWRLRLADHPLELVVAAPPPGERCLVGIRPEEVMLLHPDRPLRPQVRDNVVQAEITELLLLDGRVEVALAVAGGPAVRCRLPVCAADDLGLRPGLPIRASLKRRSLFLLEGR
ncbi:MAG: ABC transporter ATP-binding protein [Nitrospirae bacterium]|nr:MAG: ABC transporter ATP-binding protein [Nitrospirota bacterium]